VIGINGILVVEEPGPSIKIGFSGTTCSVNDTKLHSTCVDISNSQCSIPLHESCQHPTPTLQTLNVIGATTLGTGTTCAAALAPSCISISSQSCPNGPLSTNCIPSSGLVLHTLTVENLTVLNTTVATNIMTSDNSTLIVENVYLEHLYCTGTAIQPSCYDLSGSACPNGVLQESCIPDSLLLANASITGTLNVNNVVCSTGAVSDDCLNPHIKTINGIAPLNRDFTIGSSLGIAIASTLHGISISSTGVTSVGLVVPSEFSIVGSAVTTTGVLEFTKSPQSPNTIWAGPLNGLAAHPTFRRIEYDDLPLANFTLSLPVDIFASSGPLTATLIAQSAHAFFAGPGPSFRNIAIGDLPALTTGNIFMGNGTHVVETTQSFGLVVPTDVFSIANSPLIGAGGTIVVTKNVQNSNLFWAGPTNGASSQPVFRALDLRDFGPLNMTDGALLIGSTGGVPIIGTLTAGANVVITTLPGQIIISSSINASSIGTVMSVSLSLPSDVFSVTSSTVTDIGTLAASFAPQLANLIFASPDGSIGTPGFRPMVFADLPILSSNQVWIGSGAKTIVAGNGMTITVGLNTFSIGATVQFPASVFSVSSSAGSITSSFISQSARTFFAAPTASSGVPSFRTLVPADLPALGNGQFFIGSGGIPVVSSLAAGSLVTITPGPGTLTVSVSAVSSVAMTVPSFLTVSGSPITSSGTFELNLDKQTERTFFSGPVSGVGADIPTFRPFIASDVSELLDGELIIGSKGNPAVATTLTAGAGINIINGPGVITIEATASAGIGNFQDMATTDSAAISVASGTVVMTGMSETPASGTYMVSFSGHARTNSHSIRITYGIYVDGVIVAGTMRRVTNHAIPHLYSSGRSPFVNLPMHTQAVVTVSGFNVVTLQWSVTVEGITTFTMGASGTTAWTVNTVSGLQPAITNPVLHVIEGGTYTFSAPGASHPLSLKTVYQNTGTLNRYTTGVTGTPATTSTLTWTVPVGVPSVLYYQCESHSGMSGSIVTSPVSVVGQDRNFQFIKLS